MSHLSAMKAWLMQISELDSQHVILARQNGPRPEGDYITFEILATTGNSFDYSSKDEKDGDFATVYFYNLKQTTLDVNIYSDDGVEIHNKLSHSNELYSIRSLFKDDDMVFISGATPRNLTGLGDTSWRPRYQSEYRFRTSNTIAEDVERIFEYDIDGIIVGIDPIPVPPGPDSNFIFWGATTKTDSYTEADIEALSDQILSSTKDRTVSITTGLTQYMLVCSPVRFGVQTWTVSGFTGGVLAPETVSVTNPDNYTEDYYVYRSTNSNLGEISLTIS